MTIASLAHADVTDWIALGVERDQVHELAVQRALRLRPRQYLLEAYLAAVAAVVTRVQARGAA